MFIATFLRALAFHAVILLLEMLLVRVFNTHSHRGKNTGSRKRIKRVAHSDAK